VNGLVSVWVGAQARSDCSILLTFFWTALSTLRPWLTGALPRTGPGARLRDNDGLPGALCERCGVWGLSYRFIGSPHGQDSLRHRDWQAPAEGRSDGRWLIQSPVGLNRGLRHPPRIGRAEVAFILRHRKRVTCAKCGASHPAIYEGQPCLICGSTIAAVNGDRKEVSTVASENLKTEEAKEQQYKAQIAALQSERDELSATLSALTHQDVVSISDYRRYVKVAAKGMAKRDSHSMPESVTTPEAFYEVMAGAALDAVGFRALLERLARAMREPETTREPLRRAGARSRHARSRST
jgi:hypothetical protein